MANKNKTFRPDLSAYDIYVMALADELNKTSAARMSKTDAVKFALETAIKKVLPDVVIVKNRKRFISLDF
jgi:hypothetical protein